MGQTRQAGTASAHRTQSSASSHPKRTPSVENVHCTRVGNWSSISRNCSVEPEQPGGVDSPPSATETVSRSSDLGQNSDQLLPPGALKCGDWWCSLCAKSFRNGDLLTMHMQLVHRELEPSSARDSREHAAATGQSVETTAAASTAGQNTDTGTDGRPAPSRPRSFAVGGQFDAVPGHLQSRLSSLCSDSSQAPRPQLTIESRVEDFFADAQNHSLRNVQGGSCALNAERGSGAEFTGPSQGLDPRWHDFMGKSQERFTHSSQTSAAQGTDRRTGSHLDSPHSAGLSATLTPNTACNPLHTGRIQKPQIGRRCRHCQKIFHLNAGQFQEHEQKCVKQRVGLDCPQCGRSFASKVALKDHVDSLHSRKVFQCRACGMVFKWRTYVYQHRYKCAAYRIKKEPK